MVPSLSSNFGFLFHFQFQILYNLVLPSLGENFGIVSQISEEVANYVAGSFPRVSIRAIWEWGLSVPASALSLGIPTLSLSRSVLESCKFLIRVEHNNWYTIWGWAHQERVNTTFPTWKNSQVFLVLLTGFKSLDWSYNLESNWALE